jgi:type II secretory pathway pseudopilin PulG
MKPLKPSSLPLGFAIGEMFIAIGVMFVISALVIPMITMSSGFREVQEKRNAQVLASVCFQAQLAGVNFVAPTGVDPTVQNLLVGGQNSTGRHFQALGITPSDATAAAKHLRINNGNLVYSPSGF